MDISPFAALLLVSLVSLILFFATARRKPSESHSHGRRPRLPPSPPGLPLLGHLPLLGPLPHRKLQAMAAKHGPVMLLHLGRVPTVVASSAAAAQEVMKTRDVAFASRPRVRMAERLVYGRDMAFAPYGEHWRQTRRVSVLHLLSHRRVQSFRRVREQEAAAMVDRVRRIASGGGGGGDADAAAVNVTALIISYTNGIISRAAFGDQGRFGLDGGEKLAELFADFEGLLGTVTVGDFVPWLPWVDKLMGLDAKAARTSAELDAMLERVIADHRRRRRDGRRDDGGGGGHRDFVDVMLDVNEEAEENAAAGGVKFDNVVIKALVLPPLSAGAPPPPCGRPRPPRETSTAVARPFVGAAGVLAEGTRSFATVAATGAARAPSTSGSVRSARSQRPSAQPPREPSAVVVRPSETTVGDHHCRHGRRRSPPLSQPGRPWPPWESSQSPRDRMPQEPSTAVVRLSVAVAGLLAIAPRSSAVVAATGAARARLKFGVHPLCA